MLDVAKLKVLLDEAKLKIILDQPEMISQYQFGKDVLEVMGIPIMLAILARELEEIKPHSDTYTNGCCWKDYLCKSFLHQKILNEISDNRDFVLDLDPDFVYFVSQLWKSYDGGDENQWIHFLEKLSKHEYLKNQKSELSKIHDNWCNLIQQYQKATSNKGSAVKRQTTTNTKCQPITADKNDSNQPTNESKGEQASELHR
jgi:hypothetical protein